MLPDKFKFLDTIGTLPKIVSAGLQYLGLRETPGAKSNPVIMDMARSAGVSDIYTNDAISWCALFILHLLRICAKPILDHKGDRWNLLRALFYQNWGHAVDIEEAQLGDLVILSREGGGHIGILIAWSKDKKSVWLLGGNQGDMVSIVEFKKERIKAVRRYYATAAPESAKQYFIDSGGNFSTNES